MIGKTMEIVQEIWNAHADDWYIYKADIFSEN